MYMGFFCYSPPLPPKPLRNWWWSTWLKSKVLKNQHKKCSTIVGTQITVIHFSSARKKYNHAAIIWIQEYFCVENETAFRQKISLKNRTISTKGFGQVHHTRYKRMIHISLKEMVHERMCVKMIFYKRNFSLNNAMCQKKEEKTLQSRTYPIPSTLLCISW